MAMSRQTWSINGLANELDIDRRTLAKKLQGLRAAEEKDVGGRIERRWHMADVVDFLRKQKAGIRDTRSDADFNTEVLEQLKKWVGKEMYPRLIENHRFRGGITGCAHGEFGLSKEASLELLSETSFFILCAICDGFRDEDMLFHIKEDSSFIRWANAKKDGRVAELIDEVWPDKKAA